MTRKKLAASALVGATVATFGLTIPADAALQKAAYNPNVAPITCAQEDSCVLDWYANGDGQGGNDYWMARQSGGSTWVRLTLAAGMTTVGVGQITCWYEDSCMLDYTAGAWYAAQQSHGVRTSVWVRLTMVNGQ